MRCAFPDALSILVRKFRSVVLSAVFPGGTSQAKGRPSGVTDSLHAVAAVVCLRSRFAQAPAWLSPCGRLSRLQPKRRRPAAAPRRPHRKARRFCAPKPPAVRCIRPDRACAAARCGPHKNASATATVCTTFSSRLVFHVSCPMREWRGAPVLRPSMHNWLLSRHRPTTSLRKRRGCAGSASDATSVTST